MYVGVGSVAQALDLRGGLGAVFILAIAGGLVEIGLLQKLQNRGGRALAIVTFKTKHIFDSLVKYCTLCRGGQYLPAEPSGCRKAGGPMRASAPTGTGKFPIDPRRGCCHNYNTVILHLQVSPRYAIIILLLDRKEELYGPQNQRESFGSRLGFILVSAGCAIGIGNVWRFPTVTGQYGGGIFVLFYLLFLVLMGLPVLTMELAVGRAGRGAARSAYKALEPGGSKWHIHGWFCMAGCVLLMMYYTTVSGWMVDYFFRFLTGSFDGLTSEQAAGVFGEMLSNPVEMVFWMVVITLAGFVVCGRGLQGGLEKVGKWMMSALLVLILVLVVHSFTLSGAGEGLAFYLLPDWSRATGQGLGNVITAAMNQSFFTLSLGIGAIEIFGSYMDRGFTLPGEAARICVLDTFVAVCAGLIIFPACFSFGISPDAGPSLIFITLPNVFTNMAGGRLWGALFFLFMTFASFSTVIAVFENIIACARENFGWDRRRACLVGRGGAGRAGPALCAGLQRVERHPAPGRGQHRAGF